MLTIAYYFLQVMICSGIMFGYYWLVLRNKRFHQYNRFYLLAITLLAWIVPLIKIQWSRPNAAGNAQVMQFLSVLADNNSAIEESVGKTGFEWNNNLFAGLLYITVSLAMLLVMMRALIRLYRLLQKHPCKHVGEVYLILTQAKGTPFSFFRYIFWNEEIDIRSQAGKQILQHELTHVKQKHSIDKLFMQLILSAGWVNPFFWLIKKEMEMIHEFIADKKAVADGDTAALANMLLTAAYPQQQFSLANPFFFSPIKRRLQMLTNTANPRFTYIRRLVVLPLLAVVVVLFAFRNKTQYTTLSMATVMENVLNTVKGTDESSANNGIAVVDQAYLEKSYTVMIDAGHGGKDPGLVAADGTTESSITLAIAKLVKKLNGSDRIDILFTKEEGAGMDASSITKHVNSVEPDLYVSIHCEKAPQTSRSGISLFVPDRGKAAAYDKSVAIANYLNNAFATLPQSRLGIRSRQKGVWILDHVTAPAVLIETGFLSNPKELASLKDETYQSKMAAAILSGINGYLLAVEQNKLKPVLTLSATSTLLDTLPGKLGLSKALIMLDGKKISYSELESLPPDEIRSINVLKNEQAIALYGNEAANGALLITTRKNQEVKINGTVQPRISGATIPNIVVARNVPQQRFSDSLLWLKNLPLIFIDGVKYEGALKDINAAEISSISVMKNESAVEKYGTEAINGVIDITSKSGKLGGQIKDVPSGNGIILRGQPTLESVTVTGYKQGDTRIRLSDTVRGTLTTGDARGTLRASNQPMLENVVVRGFPSFAGKNDNPPSFPGGISAWARYLDNNLNQGIVAANGAPRGKYTVNLFFTVTKQGVVKDIRTENDPGYGAVAEAIRIVSGSGKWEPGERNGVASHMSHRLAITFYSK